MSRSILHSKMRERRASAIRPLNLQTTTANESNRKAATNSQNTPPSDESPKAHRNSPSVTQYVKQSPSGN